jgi:hypothetical protein
LRSGLLPFEAPNTSSSTGRAGCSPGSKVLKDLGATLLTANLANASRLGSITAEIQNNIDRVGDATKTGYTEAKHASVKAVVAEGGLSHTGTYAVGKKEPFEACLESLRRSAGSGPACMVFDNLEAIIESPDRMKELADLIILLDDDRYAPYKVKILIVGVPARLRDYFNQTPLGASCEPAKRCRGAVL